MILPTSVATHILLWLLPLSPSLVSTSIRPPGVALPLIVLRDKATMLELSVPRCKIPPCGPLEWHPQTLFFCCNPSDTILCHPAPIHKLRKLPNLHRCHKSLNVTPKASFILYTLSFSKVLKSSLTDA
ncbi:uncharacterized protein DS421_6g174500 [Arachis hypogaea]|nr:uncharacterized protein DS421_6g174500 [Arachis hypogaea]